MFHCSLSFRRSPYTYAAMLAACAVACGMLIRTAHAASSWNPTLLVNTESFQAIDSGDGTTNIELRFGSSTQTLKFLTTNRFQFSHSISVLGTISGSSLNIDRNATIGGALTVTGSILSNGNIAAQGTVSGSTITGFGLGTCNGATQKIVYNYATQKFECATDLNTQWSTTGSLMTAFDDRYVNTSGDTMTGNLVIGNNATLSVSGAIVTEGNLTINDDAGAVDAVLTFGNAAGNQTLKFLNTLQKFQFSKGLSVLGTISGSSLNVDRNATIGGALTVTGAILSQSNITAKGALSGSSLTIDGNVTIHGQTYNFPTTQTENGYLKTDGDGNLTWSATASIGNSSGFLLSMHPKYPNAIYFSSGSSFIGQLSASGGVAGINENYYHWTSSKAQLNDYWISVRVRLPDNFSTWDPVKPIELRYRTADATASNNHVTLRMKDTAGAFVALSGNTSLASASFATANINLTGGTWAPKGYVTVYVKLAALTGKFAEAGYLNLNYESTMP